MRNGNSPVRKIQADPRLLLQSFQRILYGVLDPNLAQLLKDCQLQVVLPDVHQPAPVLDLKKEGARYVEKINTAINSEDTLYDLVQQYRYEEHIEGSERHAMLLMMLGYNIEKAANDFKPKKATTLIETGEELRDRFFDTAFLTFIHYMSGNTNKTNVAEIIALTNGGRGQTISDAVVRSLHLELYGIFYPRRESGSFTMTRYEFAREGNNGAGRRLTLANYPVANAVVTAASNALSLLDMFAGCLALPQQNLLTNGEQQQSQSSVITAVPSSSVLTIQDREEL